MKFLGKNNCHKGNSLRLKIIIIRQNLKSTFSFQRAIKSPY